MFKKVVFSIVICASLAACETSSTRSDGTAEATVGTLLGGHGSGPIRTQIKEEADAHAQRTEEDVQERDLDSGKSNTATSLQQVDEDRPADRKCQVYSTEAIIKGKKETVYGTACRQSDGSWETPN